jgi:hypothetical protein
MIGRNCLMAAGLICMVLPFAGCSSSEIDSITLTPTLTDFEGTGGTVQLSAIGTIGHGAHPATYRDVTSLVTWSTPASNVAVVNSAGMVTIVGLGLSRITATVNGFTGLVSASSTVCATVPATTSSPNPISCPAVTASAFKPAMQLSLVPGIRETGDVGESVQFGVIGTSTATGDRRDMSDSVLWTSTDETVASVSRSGLVTAIGPGRATISAKLINDDKTAVAVASTFKVAATGR